MKNLFGLVVCGGQSTRMGTDKGILQYYDKPQRYHLYEMLKPFCEKVFISCNEQQSKDIDPYYNYIIDNKTYSNTGPMGALLSAFKCYPEVSFLVVGCDYPFLETNDLKKLINCMSPEFQAACFINSETTIEEPLLAIYNKECFEDILDFYNTSQYSLRHFLKTIKVKRVIPDSLQSLKSVDTVSQFRETLVKLQDKA